MSNHSKSYGVISAWIKYQLNNPREGGQRECIGSWNDEMNNDLIIEKDNKTKEHHFEASTEPTRIRARHFVMNGTVENEQMARAMFSIMPHGKETNFHNLSKNVKEDRVMKMKREATPSITISPTWLGWRVFNG